MIERYITCKKSDKSYSAKERLENIKADYENNHKLRLKVEENVGDGQLGQKLTTWKKCS